MLNTVMPNPLFSGSQDHHFGHRGCWVRRLWSACNNSLPWRTRIKMVARFSSACTARCRARFFRHSGEQSTVLDSANDFSSIICSLPTGRHFLAKHHIYTTTIYYTLVYIHLGVYAPWCICKFRRVAICGSALVCIEFLSVFFRFYLILHQEWYHCTTELESWFKVNIWISFIYP